MIRMVSTAIQVNGAVFLCECQFVQGYNEVLKNLSKLRTFKLFNLCVQYYFAML